MEIGLDELTPTPSFTPSYSHKRPQDPKAPYLSPYRRELLSPAPSSRTSPKSSSSPSQPEQPLPTTLKTACWPCQRPSTRRQGPPSTGCCLTWWLRTVMMIFQVSWELPPSQQPSKPATLNHRTHCASVQHRPSAHSAHQHNRPPSSIIYLPTCGETCLQCGASSVWGSQSKEYMEQYYLILILSNMQSNLLSKLSSSSTSAPPPAPVYATLASADHVLRDPPTPTQPSAGTAVEHSLQYISTVANLS